MAPRTRSRGPRPGATPPSIWEGCAVEDAGATRSRARRHEERKGTRSGSRRCCGRSPGRAGGGRRPALTRAPARTRTPRGGLAVVAAIGHDRCRWTSSSPWPSPSSRPRSAAARVRSSSVAGCGSSPRRPWRCRVGCRGSGGTRCASWVRHVRWARPSCAAAIAPPTARPSIALDFGGAGRDGAHPRRGRTTVCVSSQAGCTRNACSAPPRRSASTAHLTAAEIVSQYLVARAEAPAGAPARNVVFMGMGEPMDNLDAVLRRSSVLTHERRAPQLRAEHVTVSTSGVLPGMQRFLRESRASLALSLNATTDAQRGALMPQNRDLADRGAARGAPGRRAPRPAAARTSSSTCSSTGSTTPTPTPTGWRTCSTASRRG